MNRTETRRVAAARALILLAALSSSTSTSAQISYRPGQEFRSLNSDLYQIEIQKNGRLDVLLSPGEPVFLNVFPMIWFAGDAKPKLLPIDGRWSQRYQVEDPLGVGNGMLIRFKSCEWSIHAYPSKPFLAVQVAFINTRKKPVAVSQLMPWCIGPPKKGALTLGPATANATILENSMTGESGLVRGSAASAVNLAVFNPVTGRSLIAGFVTQNRARNEITLSRSPKAEETTFDRMRAVCVFDPPVVVEPGGRLESDVLYIALAEPNPLEGLERYAGALAAAHRMPSQRREMVRSRATWEVLPAADLSADGLIAELDYAAEHLRPIGISHIAIGPGWRRAIGDWERDPAHFPMSFESFTREVHQRRLTAGLWMNPFALGTTEDITTAYAAAERLGARAHDWRFDAVHGLDPAPHARPAAAGQGGPTRVEDTRRLFEAFRRGFSPGGVILAASTGPLSAIATDGLSIDAAHGSSTDAFAQAARRFYLGARVVAPEYALPGNIAALRPDQLHLHLTAAAVLGATLRIQGGAMKPGEDTLAELRRVLPPMRRPARPIDLFSNEQPRIWMTRASSAAGQSHIVAVFNWNVDRTERTTLPFVSMGLEPGAYYTVFDFWRNRYYGAARQSIGVDTPPGGVRVLVLRRYKDSPQLLASPTHIGQEMSELEALGWDRNDAALRGRIAAGPGAELSLPILVPEGFESGDITSTAATVWTESEGSVTTVHLTAPEGGEITWTLHFTQDDPR